MFVKVEMFDIQKCALPLLFSDFDFFADLQISKKIRNDHELIQSDPTSCPQNQKGNK